MSKYKKRDKPIAKLPLIGPTDTIWYNNLLMIDAFGIVNADPTCADVFYSIPNQRFVQFMYEKCHWLSDSINCSKFISTVVDINKLS